MKSFKKFILENTSNRELIVVDIQPTYESASQFFMKSFVKYLNDNEFQQIHYLYNGPEFGLESKGDIINWLYDNGVKEHIINNMYFFEKNYAFFRSFMDQGMGEGELIKLAQYMLEYKINNSRDIDEETWDSLDLDFDYQGEHGDMIFIPDVLFHLKNVNNPIICGGAEYECLREVELCLEVLNKQYERLPQFIY